MLSFILRRLLIIIPMALLVVTLTWGLIRLAPGNFYDSDKPLPPAIEANIKKKYGLDKPWYEQYGLMMLHIVQLDFGDSLNTRDSRSTRSSSGICRIRRRWESLHISLR